MSFNKCSVLRGDVIAKKRRYAKAKASYDREERAKRPQTSRFRALKRRKKRRMESARKALRRAEAKLAASDCG